MWQFTGQGGIGKFIRGCALRLAREAGGGVEYWLELPITELLEYMLELRDQINAEKGG